MTQKLMLCGVFFVAAILFANAGAAKTKVYAVVIGNNTPPVESQLTTLQYADDDAVRYHRFFKHFADDVYLMTIPDGRTQTRYPAVASIAVPPSLTDFDKIIRMLSCRIAEDKEQGYEIVVYLTFSGHGSHDASGTPYLALLGNGLTGEKLYDALALLNADFVHLFIDACYAEGVVGSRGMFEEEINSRHIQLSDQSVETVFAEKPQRDIPGLGIVTAASAHQQTHEWSQIESGVFTHEILSGLAGPADINLDGKIEYSELGAFISAANRKISDERGKVAVITRPPKRNHNIPLVDLTRFSNVAFLMGNPFSLGHFYIELENGERYLDANLGNMSLMQIVIPVGGKAYLYTENKEAVLEVSTNRTIDAAMLKFNEQHYMSRGSIEASFQKGLFEAEFGLSYYLGFIDSAGFSSVQLDAPRLTFTHEFLDKKKSVHRNIALSGYIVAGASVAAAVVFGSLSLHARNDFNQTELQESSYEAASRYRHFSTAFWITAGVVPVAVLVGLLFMPKKKSNLSSHFKGSLFLNAVTANSGTSVLTIGF